MTARDLARTVWNVVVRPRAALAELAADPHALGKGVAALAGVSAVYVLILLIFIVRGYPAAATSILPVTVDRQYPLQVWYQVPLFFGATLLAAGLLVMFSRPAGKPVPLGLAFARISLATAVPFGLTTMVVELGLALLLAAGVIEPQATLHWLTGPGAWFATLYQLIGLAWLIGLLAQVVIVSTGWGRLGSLLGTVVLAVAYGLPIALLIR